MKRHPETGWRFPTPEGKRCVPVMTVTRCTRSDLPTDMCAHCTGDAGVPALFVADSPTRPRVDAAVIRERLTAQITRPARIRPSTVTPRYPALCALGDDCRPEDRGGPRQTGGRSHVCPACEDRARDNLTAAADTWPDLQAQLVAIRALDSAGFITGGTPGTGIILNEPASAAILAATERAHFYTRLVITERGHTPDDATPVGLLRWLARNEVPWLCAHPDQGVAEAFTVDTADLARKARSAAYPAGWRTIPIPLACHTRTPDDPDDPDSPTTPCPGRMTARIRPDLHRLPDLVCDTNPGHTVSPEVWQRAGWKHAARHEAATRRFLGSIGTS